MLYGSCRMPRTSQSNGRAGRCSPELRSPGEMQPDGPQQRGLPTVEGVCSRKHQLLAMDGEAFAASSLQLPHVPQGPGPPNKALQLWPVGSGACAPELPLLWELWESEPWAQGSMVLLALPTLPPWLQPTISLSLFSGLADTHTPAAPQARFIRYAPPDHITSADPAGIFPNLRSPAAARCKVTRSLWKPKEGMRPPQAHAGLHHVPWSLPGKSGHIQSFLRSRCQPQAPGPPLLRPSPLPPPLLSALPLPAQLSGPCTHCATPCPTVLVGTQGPHLLCQPGLSLGPHPALQLEGSSRGLECHPREPFLPPSAC